jgi:hypothetical protein
MSHFMLNEAGFKYYLIQSRHSPALHKLKGNIMFNTLLEIIKGTWDILALMAPYLLLGFLIAGILSVLISPKWVEKHLGNNRIGAIIKSSLFGIPLPLCSCGVIPVSAELRKSGASKGATVAFLLSTPQTGVDSIAVTYALLGPVFAIFRPIAAFITGIAGGIAVNIFDKDNENSRMEEKSEGKNAKSCESCNNETTATNTENHEEIKKDPCCCEHKKNEENKKSIAELIKKVFKHGFITLPGDIGKALLFGVLIAGIIGTLVPEKSLTAYIGGGIGAILIMMLAGVPVYVCATASVPIAVGFMHMGASAGAAIAFLIAGPATNAATFTTLWKVLGRKSALIYLAAVAVSAVACGLMLNYLWDLFPQWTSTAMEHDHSNDIPLWYYMSGIILIAITVFSTWKKRKKE